MEYSSDEDERPNTSGDSADAFVEPSPRRLRSRPRANIALRTRQERLAAIGASPSDSTVSGDAEPVVPARSRAILPSRRVLIDNDSDSQSDADTNEHAEVGATAARTAVKASATEDGCGCGVRPDPIDAECEALASPLPKRQRRRSSGTSTPVRRSPGNSPGNASIGSDFEREAELCLEQFRRTGSVLHPSVASALQCPDSLASPPKNAQSSRLLSAAMRRMPSSTVTAAAASSRNAPPLVPPQLPPSAPASAAVRQGQWLTRRSVTPPQSHQAVVPAPRPTVPQAVEPSPIQSSTTASGSTGITQRSRDLLASASVSNISDDPILQSPDAPSRPGPGPVAHVRPPAAQRSLSADDGEAEFDVGAVLHRSHSVIPAAPSPPRKSLKLKRKGPSLMPGSVEGHSNDGSNTSADAALCSSQSPARKQSQQGSGQSDFLPPAPQAPMRSRYFALALAKAGVVLPQQPAPST